MAVVGGLGLVPDPSSGSPRIDPVRAKIFAHL